MRNSNLACGLTTGQLIANKDGDKRTIPFMYGAYGEAAETDWHMDRRGGGRGGGALQSLWPIIGRLYLPLPGRSWHKMPIGL